MKGNRPTTKRRIEPRATVDYFTPADSDVDDSTATIMPDESSLRASVQHFQANKKRLATLARKAHEEAMRGKPPGLGTPKPSKRIGIPKPDKVTCSCGVVHRKGSPGHEAHVRHFPQLCRRRTR